MPIDTSRVQHLDALDELHAVEAGFITLADLMVPERDLHIVNRDALSTVLGELSTRLNAALRRLTEAGR